jgi:DNA recombination protein RmuC
VKLKDAFKALSSEALESHQKQFTDLARAQLEQFRALMNTDFGKHAQSVEGLTKPLDETMKRYELQIQAMEKARGEAYGKLDEQLRQLVESESRLQQETGRLVTALRRPQARGAWGELTLRRVVELAGMLEHCDFSEQTTVRDDAGAMLRPDMIIHVPGGRVIPVDAKTPIDAYLTSLEAQDEESREAALAHHAKQLRAQMKLLSEKNYWQQFDGAAELVVMFVPGEAFVSAAVQKDPKLIEDGIQNGVVVASPTTLVTLLRAASYGWRQEKLAENARQVSELGKELYERLRVFLDHFDGVGKGLRSAVDRYDKAAGSLESRVLVSARRFKEFGAVDGKDLDEPVQIGHLPRELAAPELDQALPLPEAEDPTQSET